MDLENFNQDNSQTEKDIARAVSKLEETLESLKQDVDLFINFREVT